MIRPETMKRNAVRFEFDPDVDAAYLTLSKARVSNSEEVRPGLVVDFDASDEIVGIEFLRFTKRFRASPGANEPVRSRRVSGKTTRAG